MTNTTPQSAGETPAAPPDPWAHRIEDIERAIKYYGLNNNLRMITVEVLRNISEARAIDEKRLATERQHHAASLTAAQDQAGDMQLMANEQEQRAIRAEADLTAARAEIARLTEEQTISDRIWERRLDDVGAERDSYKRNANLATTKRAEAAEASLLALQQQMGTVLLRMTVAGTWGAVEKLISEARAALASHLTGGPA